jgi:hypothetical protein
VFFGEKKPFSSFFSSKSAASDPVWNQGTHDDDDDDPLPLQVPAVKQFEPCSGL